MKAYCITVGGNRQSEIGWNALAESHQLVGNDFSLIRFAATTPSTIDDDMATRQLEWTYPWTETKNCGHLRLHPYTTTDRSKRMACFMSHHRLWQIAAEGEPVLILEDDALFIERLDPGPLMLSPFCAIGINDPRHATRRAELFHRAVQGQADDICETPWIDAPVVPQGLAGASAYVIKPQGAREVITAAAELGAWPNDALLCKQLIPGLGVTRKYYTRVQRTTSTLA